jgi:hypothetical protein
MGFNSGLKGLTELGGKITMYWEKAGNMKTIKYIL